MTNKIIVGIDLGTTNSVIAVLEGAVPTVIPNFEGGRTTPSVVSYNSEGDLLVGDIAKRQRILNSENTFYSVKRFIGCNFNEIKDEVSKVSYLIKNENNKIKLYSPVLKKDFSPEEISAIVLKKLVSDAGNFLGTTLKEAIITVPAYFNDSQRTATKDAGAIAGLDVLRIINEPTAAALAYGLNKKKSETVLVFDLGGGTFDVSILEVGEDIFEVLATSGDTHLGGDDFDQILTTYILNTFKEKEKIDISGNKQILQRVLDASEKAKKELSLSKTANINIPFVYVDSNGAKHIDVDVSRSKFEELSNSLFEKCKFPVIKALKDAELTSKDIDEVLLVGGSTRIPAVREIIKTLLQKDLNERVNPDEVVAMGAAVQGGIIGGSIKDLVLLDVTPLSLGVEVEGGLMSTIITRNSSIPVQRQQVFTTAVDFQKEVDVHILQGERPLAKDNKSLGIFKLQDIPPVEAGVPVINVSFRLDSNGILAVTASESTSGKQQSIEIKGASTLSKDEIDSIVTTAEENAKSDLEKKHMISLLHDLDSYLFQIEFAIEKLFKILKNNKLFLYFKQIFNELKYNLTKKHRNLTKIKVSINKIEIAKKMLLEEILLKEIKFDF